MRAEIGFGSDGEEVEAFPFTFVFGAELLR
jgi:hypothetical protein